MATRGVPRARSAIARAPAASIADAEHAGAAHDDPREVAGRVVVEPVLDPEAVAQRRGEQPGARGGADQREARQVERDHPRARPDAERDRQLAVLHRGVERLLDRAREAVDLVDEEDRAVLEVVEVGRDVGLALERRAGGRDERHPQLLGDDPGEARLAQAGRAGEQHVVERVAARGRRRDRDAELLLELLLADELLEPARAQRRVELVLGALVRRLQRGRSPACGSSAARALQRVGDQVLGRLARRAVEQLLGLLRREAEPDEAVAREQPRVVAARDHDRVAGGRRADLLAQLDHDPLGGALADPLHGLQPRRVAGRDGGEQLARRAAREHRERDLRADGLHADQQQEQVALGLGGEAVELQRVVAHDQVRVQRRRVADRRRVAQRLGRDRQPVADAAARRRPRGRSAAPPPRRYRSAITRARSTAATQPSAPLAWQIATASASAAWSGAGRSVSASSALHHPLDLALLGAARAADGAP